jgi:hypothetical protein
MEDYIKIDPTASTQDPVTESCGHDNKNFEFHKWWEISWGMKRVIRFCSSRASSTRGFK